MIEIVFLILKKKSTYLILNSVRDTFSLVNGLNNHVYVKERKNYSL